MSSRSIRRTEETDTDLGDIKARIVLKLIESTRKLTPCQLENILHKELRIDGARIRQSVSALIAEGAIQFTYRYGVSFLERSTGQAVRVSSGIVLKPPQMPFNPDPEDIVISIAPGASFGLGDHPSTRLALRGLEEAIRTRRWVRHDNGSRILDIGTGTGVLLIAAVKMGIERGVGIDLDPCARKEAKENAAINGVENQVDVSETALDHLTGRFVAVTANLRYPTIIRLYPRVQEMMEPGGVAVMSGIRSCEVPEVIERYASGPLILRWEAGECDWCVLVFQKTDASDAPGQFLE